MNQLRNLQENFLRYLCQSDPTIEKAIENRQPNFANVRLYLYKDGYYLRLVDALRHDYPVILALLGQPDFKAMATLYIEQNPSRHYSINLFGKGLPRFLKQTNPYAKRSELAEMANFELALNRAIDTLDVAPLSPEDMSHVTPELWPKLKITPHPSLQILKLKWNIPAIWQAVAEGKSPPELTPGQTHTWIAWRRDIHTHYVMLSQPEAFMIQSMQKNLPIVKICEGLCRWLNEEQVPNYLANTILRWLHDKLLSKMST